MPPPPEGSIWHPTDYTRITFRRLLAEAINDMASRGYVSRERVEEWIGLLRNAAERELGPDAMIDEGVRAALGGIYRRFVDSGRVVDRVPGVSRFNLSMIKPQLRAELDRRIMASADLIKLHRREAIERTLQRFSGWSTSIPPGGDGTIDKRETRAQIGKSVADYRYARRRVDIDQGAKLIANISHIVAMDAGAIAGIWHSHGEHDRSYNARKEHLARANKFYLVRDSWAHKVGLVKPMDGYMDEIDAPASAPFCRCFYAWVTSPRRLPDAMLTRKGQEWVAKGAEQMGAAA